MVAQLPVPSDDAGCCSQRAKKWTALLVQKEINRCTILGIVFKSSLAWDEQQVMCLRSPLLHCSLFQPIAHSLHLSQSIATSLWLPPWMKTICYHHTSCMGQSVISFHRRIHSTFASCALHHWISLTMPSRFVPPFLAMASWVSTKWRVFLEYAPFLALHQDFTYCWSLQPLFSLRRRCNLAFRGTYGIGNLLYLRSSLQAYCSHRQR